MGVELVPFAGYWLGREIYGFNQHMFAQAVRESGYRPVVFMQHGLMVALFLVSGSIIGVWFWARGVRPLLTS